MLNRKQDLIIFSVKLKQLVVKTLQEDEAERERERKRQREIYVNPNMDRGRSK